MNLESTIEWAKEQLEDQIGVRDKMRDNGDAENPNLVGAYELILKDIDALYTILWIIATSARADTGSLN